MAGDAKGRATGCLAVVGGAVLLLLLYLLSVGPAAYISEKTGTSDRVKPFYGPVIWLHDNTPLEKPLEKYLELFGVH